MIGLIYAGGKSTRFGRDKATYQLSGLAAPNVQLAVNKLLPLCQQVIICANLHNQQAIHQLVGSHPRLRLVCDHAPFNDHGPLSALVAGTADIKGRQAYLTLAVDYPYLSEQTLTQLARHPDTYLATVNHDHYTLAHFQVSHEDLLDWLQAGDWRLRNFIIHQCHCQPLRCQASNEFNNLNYRKDEIHEK